jgi:hypothetical protein
VAWKRQSEWRSHVGSRAYPHRRGGKRAFSSVARGRAHPARSAACP